MGGAETILERTRASYHEGDYRWVVEVLNHLVFAERENMAEAAGKGEVELDWDLDDPIAFFSLLSRPQDFFNIVTP
ncbi:MAG: hypothetical protein GY866_02740 [Proteobacteria bacterium]|nr:hypothetical protein [Pseudomonadota bacterium]